MKKILCLGDSLTFGARDEYFRGYPIELMSLFKKEKGIVCLTEICSVNGETSAQLLKRCIRSLQESKDADLVIVLIGSNDVFLPTPPEIFADNIGLIAAACEAFELATVLCTLPPIVGPGLPNYRKEFCHFKEQYDEAIRKLAAERKMPLVELTDMGEYVIDTVHFDNRGYKELARRIYDVIQANVLIGD